jgi:hypothetical protein
MDGSNFLEKVWNFLNLVIPSLITALPNLIETISQIFQRNQPQSPLEPTEQDSESTKQDLTGEWISTWEKRPGDSEWAKADVTIILSPENEFKFCTRNRVVKYSYEGSFSIIDNFLLGSWKSTQENDSNHGTFLLVIAKDGMRLYGFITAYDHLDNLKYKKYILGRIPSNDNFKDAYKKAQGYLQEGKDVLICSLKAN